MDNEPMKNKPRKWIVFLIFIAISGIIVACQLSGPNFETESNSESHTYTINSMTILNSLTQGNTDVFVPLEATPEATPSSPSASVSWSQEDYLRVAQILQQKTWQESSNSLDLWDVTFTMNCSDIERGTFGEAAFIYFKVIRPGNEETRVEYHTFIRPSANWVYTSKAEYTPNINSKKPFDLSKYRISAEAALQIAEKNGGAQKRLEFENACQIDALAPGPDSRGWRVLYLNIHNLSQSYFEIAIDPQTGAFKVMDFKP